MPGFVTHYVFGVNAFKQLDRSRIKTIISQHRNEFSLGLQGPDLFYYFAPTAMVIKPNVASLMHKKKTLQFIENIISATSNLFTDEDYEIALAYIEGYIGHYYLDTRVHPYVYSRVGAEKSKANTGRHFGLESDIDREVLMHYKGLRPTEFSHSKVITLSSHSKDIIAALLSSAIMATYQVNLSEPLIKSAITTFKVENDILMDKTSVKTKAVSSVEKLVMGHTMMSGLIINEEHHEDDPCNEEHTKWANPWKPELTTTASVYDMMDEAAPGYANCINRICAIIDKARVNDTSDYPILKELLGNRSYLDGLEL